MRILFAGASGVIGRRLVPLLVADGHEVVAMTRSASKVASLEALGAKPVVCDALDGAAVDDAVAAARPEVVVNQLTDLNLLERNPRRMKEAWATNDRVRRIGTANLVGAASAAGARRFVCQSIAFAYAPGPGLRGEDDRLYLDGPEPFDDSVAALAEMEATVLDSELSAIVLRYGFWYGPGTAYEPSGGLGRMVAARRYPLIGGGHGVTSFAHIDDAAEATRLAVTSDATGIYNIVDDDPAPLREWLPAYAEAIGARSPLRVPAMIAGLVAGKPIVYFATGLSGASNEKAKRELGWSPRRPSWRTGFKEALA